MNDTPCKNTDKEIWRKDLKNKLDPDNFYAPSIHVTENGKIGIHVGGVVYVAPIEEWHSLMKTSKRRQMMDKSDGVSKMFWAARGEDDRVMFFAHKPRKTTFMVKKDGWNGPIMHTFPAAGLIPDGYATGPVRLISEELYRRLIGEPPDIKEEDDEERIR